jgi:hypothetical protein
MLRRSRAVSKTLGPTDLLEDASLFTNVKFSCPALGTSTITRSKLRARFGSKA